MKTIRRLTLGVALVVLVAAGRSATASAAPFVYATIPGADQVAEFDAAAGPLAPISRIGSGNGSFSIAVTPDGTSVYVANRDDDTVSEYDVAADGTLTPKTPGTVKTGQAPVAITVNPDGKSVYVVNNHDNTASQYDIGPGGVLSPTIPATVATGNSPAGIALTPDGKNAYVTNFCCSSTVSQYSVGTGDTLTPKTPATAPAGLNPDGLVVTPDGRRAFVTNSSDNSVSQYDIGADGALTPASPATVAAGRFPTAIAVSPDGQSVYVVDGADADVAQYSVTPAGLALKVPETIGAGTNPAQLVASPDGKHVYVTDSVSGAIWQFAGGDGPGTLSPLSPANHAIETAPPYGLAIGPSQIGFNCADILLACLVHIRPLPIPIEIGHPPVITIRTTVVRAAPLGILVQRIVGHRLVRVGRVPFGLQRTGRVKIDWSLRVNGHRLLPGRYVITLRMFDRKGNLIALARPQTITVLR